MDKPTPLVVSSSIDLKEHIELYDGTEHQQADLAIAAAKIQA